MHVYVYYHYRFSFYLYKVPYNVDLYIESLFNQT